MIHLWMIYFLLVRMKLHNFKCKQLLSKQKQFLRNFQAGNSYGCKQLEAEVKNGVAY